MDSLLELFLTLTYDDIVKSLINGLVIAAVIMVAYAVQKRWEQSVAEYNVASLMLAEVIKIAGVKSKTHGSDIKTMVDPIGVKRTGKLTNKPPTAEIYRGMLNTGNIKYFTADMQRNLAELYDRFTVMELSPDMQQCLHIISDLEQISKRKKRYTWIFK